MGILYHASPVKDIKTLEPRLSNHGVPRVYFSGKRENILVYLSNRVEKYCRETGFEHNGTWHKWASYGFASDGVIRLEEYWSNALYETYYGVKGYIYHARRDENIQPLEGISNAFYSDKPVDVTDCEVIENAYEEILKAEKQGLIHIKRYEDMTDKKKRWIKAVITEEFNNTHREEYRYFLKAKFRDIL